MDTSYRTRLPKIKRDYNNWTPPKAPPMSKPTRVEELYYAHWRILHMVIARGAGWTGYFTKDRLKELLELDFIWFDKSVSWMHRYRATDKGKAWYEAHMKFTSA